MSAPASERAPPTPRELAESWCKAAVKNGGRVTGDKLTRALISRESLDDLWELYGMYCRLRCLVTVDRATFEEVVAEYR